MIRSKDGNGCCTSWCCCIRQQIAELWQRIEGAVRGVKMNGNIIEPDGDGIVDLDVNFPVDGAMDPTSVNPVQNRVVTDAILTERSERIEDDRRHDLQIQGLENEIQTKVTTPSGGVQGQVIGKGAQGVEWLNTLTEQDKRLLESAISNEIADRTMADDNIRQWVRDGYQTKAQGTPAEGQVIAWNGSVPLWTTPAKGVKTLTSIELKNLTNRISASQIFNFRAEISGGDVTNNITMFYTGVCTISATEWRFSANSMCTLVTNSKPTSGATLRVNTGGVYTVTYKDPDTGTVITVTPTRVRVTGIVADANPF